LELSEGLQTMLYPYASITKLLLVIVDTSSLLNYLNCFINSLLARLTIYQLETVSARDLEVN
jgi:hypothetical protein